MADVVQRTATPRCRRTCSIPSTTRARRRPTRQPTMAGRTRATVPTVGVPDCPKLQNQPVLAVLARRHGQHRASRPTATRSRPHPRRCAPLALNAHAACVMPLHRSPLALAVAVGLHMRHQTATTRRILSRRPRTACRNVRSDQWPTHDGASVLTRNPAGIFARIKNTPFFDTPDDDMGALEKDFVA